MSYIAFGKPPKSWTVPGWAPAVTRTPRVYQCAETQMMPLGLPNSRPRFSQQRVTKLSSSTLPGLPWPKKMAGWGLPLFVCI